MRFEVETERGITAVEGVAVGHFTDTDARTGCTVVLLPEPNVVAAETRGAAPGSRETALLEPGMSVQQADAIVLSGGSAFGLAAADGVMGALAARGRGFETPAGRVPIVPAAVVFDLLVGDPSVRPGASEGIAALDAAGTGPVAQGLVGAGTGATVAKWRGFDHAVPGGLGSASVRAGDVVVGALVVVNAVGDVFTLEGVPLSGGTAEPGPPAMEFGPAEHTTLVVVATNVGLPREGLLRLAVRAQDALAACLRPAHTPWDGDTAFAVSAGDVTAPPGVAEEAAFVAVARAIERAVRASEA